MDVNLTLIREPGRHGRSGMRGLNEARAAWRTAPVLVVDDDLTSRRILMEQLKRLGVDAAAVTNGCDAVEAIERDEFGLVFMDLDMPEMDGHAATRRIRATELGTSRRVPIVALTASLTGGTRERCLADGMDEFYSKPLGRATLLAALVRWLLPAGVARSTSDDVVAAADADNSILGGAPMDLARLFETFGDDERSISAFLREESIPDISATLGQLAETITRCDAATSSKTARRVRGAASTIGADMIAVAMMTVEVAVLSANWESAQTSLALASASAARIAAWLSRQPVAA